MSDTASLVARSLAGFKTLLNTGTETGSDAVSHLARFKIWASSLGAHRFSGSRSLEYRLRDASSLRNHIIRLLQELCDLLEEAATVDISGDDPNSSDSADIQENFDQLRLDDDLIEEPELKQILGEIGGVVDCLLRLSIAISNPAPHDHFMSRVEGAVTDSYAPWDFQHVREKFPAIDDELNERLGKAITVRRRYFRYREEHHNRLAEGLDDDHPEPVAGGERTTIASSLPERLKDSKQNSEDSKPLLHDFGDFEDAKSETSQTSYALSSADLNESRVPPLPKAYIDGPFVCPFCYSTVNIDSKLAWKKHVFRDLRPYICLSSDCSTPDHQYLRRSEWADHMNGVHWRIWRCPFGCSDEFQKPDDLRSHVRTAHSNAISENSLDSLSNLTSYLDLTKAFGNCPLCHNFRITSAQQYISHVGTHLELLSLFALPKNWDGNESEEEPAEDGETNDDNDASTVDEKLQETRCALCLVPISDDILGDCKTLVECGHIYCPRCVKDYHKSFDEQGQAQLSQLDRCFQCEWLRAADDQAKESAERHRFASPSPSRPFSKSPTQAETQAIKTTGVNSQVSAIAAIDATTRQLHRWAQASGPEFAEITAATRSLRLVLKLLRIEVEAPDSLLNTEQFETPLYTRQLEMILENCDLALKQLNQLLEKSGFAMSDDDSRGDTEMVKMPVYMRSLGHRVKFAVVHTQLANSKRNIDSFLDAVSVHNPDRLLRQFHSRASGQIDDDSDLEGSADVEASR